MAYRQLKDARWICYWYQAGKWKRKYFGRGAAAEAAARQYDQDLGLKKTRPKKRSFGPTFADLAWSYAKHKRFSANSAKMLVIRLTADILPYLGNKTAVKLTDEDLDGYIEKRLKDKVGKTNRTVKYATIKREVNDIKAIMNWAARRRPKLISFNPIKDFPVPAAEYAKILPPTAAETRRILAKASPHLTRAIWLSYYLSQRPHGELLSLTWDRVSWEAGTIRIMSAHKGGPEIREVPLHAELVPLLKIWYFEDKGKGPIVHYHGRPVKSIKKAWQGALERAKIKRRIRPYDLRHHFETRALEGGADIKALAEIVGSRLETLMKYYQHVSRKMHHKTVGLIPALVPKNRTKNAGSRSKTNKGKVTDIKANFRHVAQGESATLTR